MTHDRSCSAGRHPGLRPALLALGLASAAAVAQAQTPPPPGPGAPLAPPTAAAAGAATSNPDTVTGVTVEGRRPDAGVNIPDDKKAAYDAEVAREAAFRAYRQSTPKLTTDNKGLNDPNEMSRDFPGLQSYVPPK